MTLPIALPVAHARDISDEDFLTAIAPHDLVAIRLIGVQGRCSEFDVPTAARSPSTTFLTPANGATRQDPHRRQGGRHSVMCDPLDLAGRYARVEHLPRYLAEHDYRYSTRDLDDSTRMRGLVESVGGRRLTYKPLAESGPAREPKVRSDACMWADDSPMDR